MRGFQLQFDQPCARQVTSLPFVCHAETPPSEEYPLTMKSQRETSETRDVPFMKNDMNDSRPTTGWPVDVADAPGKADSELFEADEIVAISNK